MKSTPRLSKTGIEYGDLAWNFYSGCQHKAQGKCPPVPCWAAQFVKRFPKVYPNGFEPTFYPGAFLSPFHVKKPSRILVCFMGDLFGDWVDLEQKFLIKSIGGYQVKNKLKRLIRPTLDWCPQHTFIFLTKNPRGMIPWGKFPDNCEVGFSAWSRESFIEGLRWITKVDCKVKWCSLEPLLEWSDEVTGDAFELLDWVAVGALTGTKGQMQELTEKYPSHTLMKISPRGNYWGLMPPLAWLRNIVENCDKAGTKVFIKDNLYEWIIKSFTLNKDLTRYIPGYFLNIGKYNVEGLGDTYVAYLRQECGARD